MRYKVLIVDDEDLNLKSTGMCLENWGYQVETAKNGDEAIRAVRTAHENIAVILMDY